MDSIRFDGQQSDERILHTILPHPFAKTAAVTSVLLLSLIFFLMILLIGNAVPFASEGIILTGTLLCFSFVAITLWFIHTSYAKDRTYITDRRIIRFDTTTPFFHTKRALFWTEALKAKAFAPNLLRRLLRIGTLIVEPVLGDGESVSVKDVAYYEDLANYIDKILYIVKNNRGSAADIRPFISKSKGKRE